MNYLEKLNEPQRQAVLHGNGPILILAGAGSGKTRVLTHRIAHLILNHGVDPTQIFSVTFTNKAAAEMRERVTHILGRVAPGPVDPRDLWISTFHSACVRILRSEIQHLGYSNTFTIYDDSDQLSVVKAVMKELHLSDSMYSPKAMQSKINRAKNDGVDHLTYKPLYGGPIEDAFTKIFARYSEVLKASSALDFADLILMTVKLFQNVPQVLLSYQRRFPYLLIDEYQDTNKCQYLLMKLLAGTQANICAVGDEDQSIYKWRGADISNILNFEKDFPNAQIFKLEQNY
ncbi:MAG: ATP-dependent DNA helicase PcrA, partial [Deltaproteobacteria bacterium]|nr:ATP-dependent DNA helicase PcrA [Deltaproteobacteria bacterium]